MTEEQLNKEAEEYATSVMKFKDWTEEETKILIEADFKAGYRSRDKEVEELKDLVWRAIACGDHVFSLELNQIKRELKELSANKLPDPKWPEQPF